VVELSEAERVLWQTLISKGRSLARKIQHAQVLLKADSSPPGPGWPDQRIAPTLRMGVRTVERMRQRLVEHGLEDALVRRQREHPPRRRIWDGAAEARLVALACSTPPSGRQRWTLQLLADHLVQLKVVEKIDAETVRRALKKTKSNLG